MSYLINPDTIVSCKVQINKTQNKIKYKNKFLWIKEGFYYKFVGYSEFIDKEKEHDYKELIFNYKTRKCFYKPYVVCYLADDSRIRKYFENKYLLSAWIIKNIPKKFIDWEL